MAERQEDSQGIDGRMSRSERIESLDEKANGSRWSSRAFLQTSINSDDDLARSCSIPVFTQPDTLPCSQVESPFADGNAQ